MDEDTRTPSEIVAEALAQPAAEPAAVEAAPPPAAPAEAPPAGAAPPAEQPAGSRYDSSLQRLMAQARASREKQVAEMGSRENDDLLQRLKLAKELGPDAVLKVAGVEREKVDVAKLLGLKRDEEDDEPKSVKEMKAKISELDNYIASLKQQQEQEASRRDMEQRAGWEQAELQRIASAIDKSKDRYEYVAAAKAIGSDRDIFNGMISMYNQGYTPSHDEIADLVESRIEQLVDLLAPTKKFQEYIAKASKRVPSSTLTSSLRSETPPAVSADDVSDEENLKLALQAAHSARDDAMKRIGALK